MWGREGRRDEGLRNYWQHEERNEEQGEEEEEKEEQQEEEEDKESREVMRVPLLETVVGGQSASNNDVEDPWDVFGSLV